MGKPRVLVAWEMGSNFGHVTKIARVVAHLQDEVDLYVALKEPWQLRQVAPDLKCRVLPAPFAVPIRLPKDAPPSLNYAGILGTEGWDNAERLGGLVDAWRGLIDLVRPDVLLAQSAPTALLAARGLDLKTIVLGGGYDNPPLAHPMPLFGLERKEDAPRDQALARDQETRVRDVANAALAKTGTAGEERFCDLIRPGLSLLMSWPFNDHYGDRSVPEPDHPPYLGPIITKSAGAEYHWADKSGAKIFAYLRPGTPAAASGLRALAALGETHDVICAAPGLPKRGRDTLLQRGVQVEDGPIMLDPLLEACDLGLNHASSGIAAVFAMAGIRQVGLPVHREQAMYARTSAKHGLSVGIEGQYGPEAVVKCIETLLADTSALTRVRDKARRIANQFSTDPSQDAAERIRAFIH